MKNTKVKLTIAEINRIKRNKARRIKRANDKFAKLTPAQKRVVIAKDVLFQMETGFIIPKSGIWAEFDKEIPKDKPEIQLQSFLKTPNSCEACGLGSLFICAVKLFDDLKLKKVVKDLEIEGNEDGNFSNLEDLDTKGIAVKTIFSYLKKFFSKEQLEKIESAFEVGAGYFSHKTETSAIIDGKNYFADIDQKLNRFGIDLSDKLKLKLIMQNIIKNNGTFKTDDKNKPKFKYQLEIDGV